MVLKPRPIIMPAKIGYSLRRGRGGSSNCMWGVQTHSGPPVFLVPFRKDLARMNGTPQPNQKWLPALGIEPGSLNHKPQPLTIGPFLTPGKTASSVFAMAHSWAKASQICWAYFFHLLISVVVRVDHKLYVELINFYCIKNHEIAKCDIITFCDKWQHLDV